jgi:hypothetical protein
MVKRLLAVMFALAVIALGSEARLLAHPGHEHKVMGTVKMAAADHIMLKDKDGKELTLREALHRGIDRRSRGRHTSADREAR